MLLALGAYGRVFYLRFRPVMVLDAGIGGKESLKCLGTERCCGCCGCFVRGHYYFYCWAVPPPFAVHLRSWKGHLDDPFLRPRIPL